jgi:hypothetical protein
MTKMYEKRANKGHQNILFEQGNFVWMHLRKDRFPEHRKSKLQPRAEGPFKVLRKINDKAYEIDLPSTYGVCKSFNVIDPSPYFGLDELRMTPFEEGEDNEDITTIRNPDALVTSNASKVTPSPPLVTHQESSTQPVRHE